MSVHRGYRWFARSLLLVSVSHVVIQLLPTLEGRKQPDFQTYYYAVKAHQQGWDPYELESLRSVSGKSDLILNFVYPPHSLSLFRPLTLLEYRPAYYLFFSVKLLSLMALVWLWLRIVPITTGDRWAVWVTVMLGYRDTVLRDLRAGNISLFEQLFIWGGVLLLLRHKTIVGGLSILLSSICKLATAVLGAIIVAVDRSRRALSVWLLLTLGTAVTYVALYRVQPELWMQFVTKAVAIDERGEICPSSLALLRDAADVAGFDHAVAGVAYALWCVVILSTCTWAFWQTRHSHDRYPMLYLIILGYVLATPRMKDYSYIIALLPTLHAISAISPGRWWAVAGTALFWMARASYLPLVLSLYVFALLLRWIWKNRRTPNRRMELILDPLSGFRGFDLIPSTTKV